MKNLVVVALVAGMMVLASCGNAQKKAEQAKLDSARIADSIAKVQADSARVADSLAQIEQARLDSIAQAEAASQKPTTPKPATPKPETQTEQVKAGQGKG
ncbi:MAG: hypothetical protein QMD02_03600 [Bacteroidales bacterium]|nr:hypothetical protein [Bacteroidales bacterium]